MVRFSSPVRFSSTAAFWPARPMRERSCAASRTTSRPATRAVPASGERSVERMRTVVVLPAPFGPSTPSTVPGAASSSTPSSARTSPNDLTRPLTSIAGGRECIGEPSQRFRSASVLNIEETARVAETTSSRLLTLLSLLQGRRDWPGQELADRLDVSGRTVRRDVDRLRELGYPVESLTGPGRRLPARGRHRDAAAAARRRRGDRDRGRPAHRRARVGDRDRGDVGARAGQARAGAARPPAPARAGARRRDHDARPTRAVRPPTRRC